MNESERNLTERQRTSLPSILGAPSITEGCKAAGISKTTFYEWLKSEAFREAYQLYRREVVNNALDELKRAASEAVSVLRGLLAAESEGVRLRAATAVLDHVGRFIELEELEARMDKLEGMIRNE